MQSSRYEHARQMNGAKACNRKLRSQLGRVLREIERRVQQPAGEFQKLLATAHRIHAQQRYDKNKIYSVHEPERGVYRKVYRKGQGRQSNKSASR